MFSSNKPGDLKTHSTSIIYFILMKKYHIEVLHQQFTHQLSIAQVNETQKQLLDVIGVKKTTKNHSISLEFGKWAERHLDISLSDNPFQVPVCHLKFCKNIVDIMILNLFVFAPCFPGQPFDSNEN